MRKLLIEKPATSSSVVLDPENCIFELSVETSPPNAIGFYEEITHWPDEFTRYLA